ncbi:FtsX-like permease family protein [Bacteroidota bacterium]
MITPPKILNAILAWVVDYREKENLTGDFSEVFSSIAAEAGYTKAIGWYLLQILKLIPVSIIESIIWSLAMFNNYFKIAFRNMLKQKSYSLINISGLALGIAVTILILLYVRAELSYDTFNEKADRIYRLERQSLNADGAVRYQGITLAPSFTIYLEKDFPEFEHIARIYRTQTRVECGEKNFAEDNIFFAEDDIFEIFTLPMIKGNPKTALTSPFSIVISESIARKYFGNEEAMGKELLIWEDAYHVTGIIKDTPVYSHIHFDMIPSYLSLRGIGGSYNIKDDYFLGGDNFSDNVTFTYALISENADVSNLYSRIPEFLDRNVPQFTLGDGRIVDVSQLISIGFRNILDIHIRSGGDTDIEPITNTAYITLFTLVAVFILIIACINFINLSTARGTKRAKEVGLRKVVGAARSSLIKQFIGESVFLSFLAVLFAVIITMLVIPYFEAFTGTSLNFNILDDQFVLFLLLGVFLAAGFISGIYPAIYLSSFNTASILRGEITRGTKGALFRKVLVVFQFAVSAALIMCVGIIYEQMNYMKNADLGFDKENLVLFAAERNIRDNWDDFKSNLLRNSNIISVTASKRAPSGFLGDAPGYEIELNGEIIKDAFSMPHNRVWHDFFKTYKMEIIAGRDISIEHPTDDSLAYVLNETACRKLGITDPNDVIGARFKAAGFFEGKVVGVVKDFNYETLRHEIVPIVTYISRYVNTVSIRIAPGNFQNTIDYIERIFSTYNPGAELEYNFLDDRLNSLYKNEADMMKLFSYFSILAIIIGCLGLFGLAAFTAEQKTKEIGIRKTLGASVGRITYLLSSKFALWVLIANLIAIPVVYYFMTDWLTNFAYRTEIGIFVFIIAIIISLLIAVLTVSLQTIKAAVVNPAESLRTE